MLWAIRQLSVPLNYLRIKHGDSLLKSKSVYDFVFPVLLSALTCGLFSLLDISLAIFKHPNLVQRFTDLLELMIVFYMAALAAVATFERKGIDKRLKDRDATLIVRDHDGGAKVEKNLSYRQFISYLFGYLSFLSLCLYVTLTILDVWWPKFEAALNPNGTVFWMITRLVDPAIFFLVFFFVWQLIVTSLLGIYFLTDRVQTINDPEN